METCEIPRELPKTDNNSHSSYRSSGKYGFIDRVIDGIFVRINSVLVKLVSKTFQASVELSRLTVQSMTPRWKPSEHLRDSRVKDSENDAILLFKEIEWQNTRIHASSVNISTTDYSSPLRLIANQAKIRITMKKKIADSSIISSRLQLYLDDLLWVLTKTQLKEAIFFANSLSRIIENSAAQSKQRAAEKLQHQVHHTSKLAEERPPSSLSPSHAPQPPPARVHSLCYDVKSTSYHLFINPINLHLCDDSTNTTGNKDRLWNIEGGSMQITIYRFCMDFYPFHPAGSERDQWHNYETVGCRKSWVKSLFADFKKDAVNIKSIAANTQSANSTANQRPTAKPRPPQSPAKSKSTKLLESCCVVKVKDIAVYMVSTSSTKQSTLHKFLAADKQVPLPSDTCTSLIHLQYTDYFFPEEMQYAVPDANVYAVFRPIRLTVDYTTLLWANYFFMDLSQNVDYDMLESEEPSEHMNIKVEAIMPRIIIPSETKIVEQPERPEYVQIVLSQVTATNVRIEERSSRAALQKVIDKYEEGDLFYTQSFPNGNKKFQIIPEPLRNHAENKDNPYIQAEVKEILKTIDDNEQNLKTIQLESNTLKKKAECDIWCLNIDTVCLDFLGVHNHKSRPVPFVEAFPMTLWLSGKTKSGESSVEKENRESRPSKMKLKQYYSFDEEEQKNCDKKELADNHVIADIGAKISLQINHYQYLFLLRLSESFARFQSQLESDLILFANAEPKTFCIPLLVPAVEVAIISPYLAHLQMFTDEFDSPLHLPHKHVNPYSPEHHVKIMAHKKQASNSAPNRISINTTDSTSSLEDNAHMITKSMSESTIHAMPLETCDFTNDNEHISVTVEEFENVVHDTNFNPLTRKASSTNAIPTEVHHQEMHAASSFGGDSGVFMDNRSQMSKYSKHVKSAFSFINDRLKPKLDDDALSVDDDAMSISTEISEEEYVCLSLIDDQDYPAFHDKQSETASVTDTYSDDGSSVYAESCTTKPKESVYVTVFLLDDLQLILHGNDKVSNIGLQVLSLSTCCYGNTSTDDIHLKLAGRGFFDNKERDEDQKQFPIKLEYVAEALPPHGSKPPSPEHKVDKAGIKLHVKGVVIDLKLSSVTALTEFIEDELVPEIIPIHIEVSDLLLILTEDRPTLNVGAPTPPPQNVHINRLLIERGFDGVFQLKSLSSSPVPEELFSVGVSTNPNNAASLTSESSFKSSMILLQTENYKLTQKLAEMNRIKKENEVLITKISLTTSEFEKLRNENITLVDRVKSLTNKLSSTDTSTDKLEAENSQLHTRLSELEEAFERNTTETESLQKTVKFLQNELQAAEKRYQKKMAEKAANDKT